MIRKILSGVMIATFFLACNNKSDSSTTTTSENEKNVSADTSSAFSYNEDFVKKENSLEPMITTTEENVQRFMDAEKYDSIAVAGEKLEHMIDDIITQIKNAPAPGVKGGEEFKQAGIRYFDYMKQMYVVYKDFGNAKNEAGRNEELNKLQELTAKKPAEMQHIQEAQQKFAGDNGFRIRQGY